MISAFRLIDAKHITFLVWVGVFNQAPCAKIEPLEIRHRDGRRAFPGRAQPDKQHASQKEQEEAIEPCSCHARLLLLSRTVSDLRVILLRYFSAGGAVARCAA